MAKTLFNLRLDDERLRWVRGYAVQRGTSASGVVVAAIDLLRGMATGGVPDLPLQVPPRDGRAKRSPKPAVREQAPPGFTPAAVGRRAETLGVHPDVLARQRKLNAGKYGGKP